MRCPETKMFGEGGEGAGVRRCKIAGWGIGETYLNLLRLDTRSAGGLRGVAGKIELSDGLGRSLRKRSDVFSAC
jgi:hypothetical protein